MPDGDHIDTGALPATEPHWPPIFDTGPHPKPLPGPAGQTPPPAPATTKPNRIVGDARPAPVTSVVVSGQYQFLKWWQLVLVLVAVWIPASGIGLGLFTWWYSLADKTPAVFVVVVYAAVCTVAGLMLAMVGDRPLVAALAIAVMSAVFASTAAAAPLYGHHYCQVKSPCVGGIIPY